MTSQPPPSEPTPDAASPNAGAPAGPASPVPERPRTPDTAPDDGTEPGTDITQALGAGPDDHAARAGLVAESVAVDGPHGPLLPPTSLHADRGRVLLVAGPPGSGHTALALCLAGRMRPARGRITLDGDDSAARLRRAVAVVDTPGVSEPEPVLPLSTVVGEELAMAGRGALPRTVLEWLAARGADRWAKTRFEDVPAPTRIALMTELAASRPGTEVLVLTAPDRHGGTPITWWHTAREHASNGLAVVVTCGETSAALLGVPAVRLGADHPDPVREEPGRHARPDDPTAPITLHDDPEVER